MGAKMPSRDGTERPHDYDPDFQGPLKNRSCTDVICLLLFVAFIAAWLGIGFWAVKNGNPDALLAPTDSRGLRCGIDQEVKDQKYLFFFDLTKCLDASTPIFGCQTAQVCVRECPTENFFFQENSTNAKAMPFCEYDYRSGSYNREHCPSWYLTSSNFKQRCIPGQVENGTLVNIASILENHTVESLYNDLPNAMNNIQLLTEIEQGAEKAIEDVMKSWWKILIGAILAIVACLVYILMLRWVAGVMVWISIGGALVALGVATYLPFHHWRKWKSQYNYDGLQTSKLQRDTFLGIFIVMVSILSIILLVLVFLRKRIVLAIALIKEGSRAVSSVTASLFFPIVPWIMQALVIGYAVLVGVLLYTTGTPSYRYRNLSDACRQESKWTVETECNKTTFEDDLQQFPSCKQNATCLYAGMSNDAYYRYLQGANVFGFFWLTFFASALGQMVLAQVFAQWYWTRKKSSLPFFALTGAFYRTVRYHLGTLAFGSLIIAICRMIRVVLEYIDRKTKKFDNPLTKAIMCCCKCFFWCLEKFLKFINKNAYIMCAIHGKNFCTSAKDAFLLLIRNFARVFVLDKVTDFLFFLSKLLITAGAGAVAYLFFATNIVSFMDNSQLNYGVTPVVMIMIITYLVATLFFSVYSMAVDTLFLCFLEDSERNDGKSRPYFMPRNLMKIFGKKNKGPKYE